LVALTTIVARAFHLDDSLRIAHFDPYLIHTAAAESPLPNSGAGMFGKIDPLADRGAPGNLPAFVARFLRSQMSAVGRVSKFVVGSLVLPHAWLGTTIYLPLGSGQRRSSALNQGEFNGLEK
jgi:hypothetical protein